MKRARDLPTRFACATQPIMPRDGRTLKKTRKAVQTRLRVRKWLETHGEPARAYQRATAELSRARRKAEKAYDVLTRSRKLQTNSKPVEDPKNE